MVYLSVHAIGVLFMKLSPVPMHLRLFATFSVISFTVSLFILISLIHLDLSVLHGNRCGSIYILLHADIQLDQHHLLKLLCFIHCITLTSLSKIRCPQVCEFMSDLRFKSIEHVCFVPIACVFVITTLQYSILMYQRFLC